MTKDTYTKWMVRLNARKVQTKTEIMQELLNHGAIRPECVAEYKAEINRLSAGAA